jgi:hypothetical protein
MAKAKDKGHTFERTLREQLIKAGYSECLTSRYASRIMDDKKVDLIGTPPFHFQAKAVERLMNYASIIATMPNDSNWNVVLHKMNYKGVIAGMLLEDFNDFVRDSTWLHSFNYQYTHRRLDYHSMIKEDDSEAYPMVIVHTKRKQPPIAVFSFDEMLNVIEIQIKNKVINPLV